MQFDPESTKQPYSSPAVTELTFEQAKQFVTYHAIGNDQQAIDFWESLRQEQRQN